jgi:ATP-dependent 26S proteasome regulatory subunit
MTSRPDLLPIDLKRQGRAEEHISLFYPETEEDRKEIAVAMARKNKVTHTIEDWSSVTQNPLHLSGADIESIIIRTRRIARQAGRSEVTEADLKAVAEEFTPARDEQAIEYQELVAAREATTRSMLPKRFQDMTSAQMSQRIDELRLLVG